MFSTPASRQAQTASQKKVLPPSYYRVEKEKIFHRSYFAKSFHCSTLFLLQPPSHQSATITFTISRSGVFWRNVSLKSVAVMWWQRHVRVSRLSSITDNTIHSLPLASKYWAMMKWHTVLVTNPLFLNTVIIIMTTMSEHFEIRNQYIFVCIKLILRVYHTGLQASYKQISDFLSCTWIYRNVLMEHTVSHCLQ